MDRNRFHVQWKLGKYWRSGPTFSSESSALSYLTLRQKPVSQGGRVFDNREGREPTDDELSLLLNVAHCERRRWLVKLKVFFRTREKWLSDRTDKDYEALSVIADQIPVVFFDDLSIKKLRQITRERWYRAKAVETYGLEEVGDNAQVVEAEGGFLVNNLWVPERLGAGDDDGRE